MQCYTVNVGRAAQRHRTAPNVVENHPLAQLDCITLRMEWDRDTGAWVTVIPELSGISTFGKTQQEALENTRDMVLAWLDSMEQLRLRIPLSPSEIRKIRTVLG